MKMLTNRLWFEEVGYEDHRVWCLSSMDMVWFYYGFVQILFHSCIKSTQNYLLKLNLT